MSDTVIKIENLSKQYRLGQLGTGTISHDLNRWWHQIRGKKDPYLKVGEINDRSSKGESEYAWALKDINFEVKKGEVLGVIGKNGAGKSTLLKILSKVTGPTTGSIKTRGSIASLLEVGTGFHPEMTGRENIYMNGTIMGMSRQEINKKLDEIVDFAGVERYLDTPVKRYSSGMTVRLGFSIAAHLEPKILIVDEVLAVGDAEFQKKAIGKMQDVSQSEGRTVLFVSHNMDAVKNFCTRSLVLKNGQIDFNGETTDAINHYLKNYSVIQDEVSYTEEEAIGNESVLLRKVKIKTAQPLYNTNELVIEFTIDIKDIDHPILDLTFFLNDEMNNNVFVGSTAHLNSNITYKKGLNTVKCTIPGNLLNEGTYFIERVLWVRNRGSILMEWNSVISFEVLLNDSGFGWKGGKRGIVRPKLDWKLNNE